MSLLSECMFHKKDNRITSLTFYKYTLFDGLIRSTRRYFSSCVVFYVVVVWKIRAMKKMSARVISETIE